ncbi:MAG TPA: DUF2851 family protein [Thermomicrobiales bacterium]|jgi:hypothetical protein|nr:DUF2851 family protein [Thermomicrobiales bacterium]
MASTASDASPTAPKEIALSAAWNAQAFRGPIRTREGRSVDIIARGTWTHGFGPDFRDAMIALDGRELRTGSVEIHLTTRGWREHGHDRDPRYDDVVLHIVLDDDGSETRRSDGMVVPVAAIGHLLTEPLDADATATSDWSRFGGEACAPDLVRDHPAIARQVLYRLGDTRLAARAARLEARLTEDAPGHVLYATLLDGLGYGQNRVPMADLAATLPLADLEAALLATAPSDRLATARALLLGTAGFLPLAPTDAALAHLTPAAVAEVEAHWQRAGAPWRHTALAPTAWQRARVRPANHPAARLVAGAALVTAALDRGGLVAALLEPLRGRALAVADEPGRLPDLVEHLRVLSTSTDAPGIGTDRAAAIVASGLLPFALALAAQNDDYGLMDGAALVWERLPWADSNEVTRRALGQVAGSARLTGLGTRGQQGLIHLDQTLCGPRRCRECPIAHASVATASAE